MASPTVADAVVALCERAGLDSSLVDVTRLAPGALSPVSTLRGYVIGRPSSAAECLKVLMQAYFFDACESDGKLRFVPRGLDPQIVQANSAGTLSGSALVATGTLTPGNILLAFSSSDVPLPYPHDGGGLVWTALYTDGAGYGIWWCIVPEGAGPSVNVTFDSTGFFFTHMDSYVVEISGGSLLPEYVTATGTTQTGSVSLRCLTLNIGFHATPIAWKVALLCLPPGISSRPLYIAFVDTNRGSLGFPLTLPAGWTYQAPGRGWTAVISLKSPIVIPEDDLGLVADKAKLTEQILQEQDLPKGVTVLYNDPALDYQQGKQHKNRSVRVVKTKNKTDYIFPLTLTRDDSRKIAETILFLAWLERSSYQMNLARPFYMLLDPTDIMEFAYESLNFLERITGNNLGQGFATALDGVSDDARNYLSNAIGAASLGFTPSTLRALANTLLFLYDIPLLRDQDANTGGTGFYFGMSSADAGWVGGILFESTDDTNFTQDVGDAQPLSFAYAVNALAAPRSPWTWDEVNTLTITPVAGTPAGDSFLNVLNGSNVLVCGNGEIIQFRNAVQSGANWILSGLLRGRRGTEWACGTHAIGETVVAPQSGMQRAARALSAVGQLRYYRAPTVGQTVSSVLSQQMTLAGNDLKPYAPVNLGGIWDFGADIILTWLRRTRIGGSWQSGTGSGDVPISEDAESYDVEILSAPGGSLKRTISGLATPTAIYTVAMQTADFGSQQSSVAFNVYQNSAQVGRGYKASGIAPTPGGWPAAAPEVLPGVAGSGSFYVNGG